MSLLLVEDLCQWKRSWWIHLQCRMRHHSWSSFLLLSKHRRLHHCWGGAGHNSSDRMKGFFLLVSQKVKKSLWMTKLISFLHPGQVGHLNLIHDQRPDLHCWHRGSDQACLTNRWFPDLKARQLLKNWGRCFLSQWLMRRLGHSSSEQQLCLCSRRHSTFSHHREVKMMPNLMMANFWLNQDWWRWLHRRCWSLLNENNLKKVTLDPDYLCQKKTSFQPLISLWHRTSWLPKPPLFLIM